MEANVSTTPARLCCDLHKPGEELLASQTVSGTPLLYAPCCDPADCGPCCPDCPTCPTLQRIEVPSATG